DLRGIRIPGADLSDSQLDSAQLHDADLTDVTFARSWMRQLDLSGAQMGGVRFGELPLLKEEAAIYVCAYSPNGRMLAVRGEGRVLSIYDTTTWNRAYQHSIDGRWAAWSAYLVFSPNNQQLVYGRDVSIRLWNFANNDTVLDMAGHVGLVYSVAFSPCGGQCASAGDDATVRLWCSKTGECVCVLKGHTGPVADVAYCADGKRISSGSSFDGTIRVWDSKTGEAIICWNINHERFSTPLAFSADGQWVAVVLRDKIQITNAVTGEPGHVLNNGSKASCIAFSSNGQWIVTSAHGDIPVQLWDISSGLLISTFPGHTPSICSSASSQSDLQIASGDGKGHIRLWEVDTSRAIFDLEGPTGHVLAVTYCPDGRSILSGSSRQGVQQWDSATGVPTPLPFKTIDDVSSFSLSPDGSQIATGQPGGRISLWNRQVDAAEYTFRRHPNSVKQLVYSPCGRWIVSVGWYHVRLWDLHTNEHPSVIAHSDWLTWFCVAFTPTGLIVLGWSDGESWRTRMHWSNGTSRSEDTIRFHEPCAQDPCTALKEISMPFHILSLDCSPDGKQLAIGSFDGTIYLWDLQSEKPFIELKGHNNFVYSVAYSPCGKWVISGSEDKTARIWRYTTGEVSGWSCVTVVGGCAKAISSLAWNPVVTTLEFVTGCKDGSVRVWRIASHEDADGGDVSVRMLWGNDAGILCALGLTFKGAIGLSPVNQKLLVQHGAIFKSPPPEGYE
ncbi:hypothetical protein BGX24_005881, partial [Mortierella sp. AD032]